MTLKPLSEIFDSYDCAALQSGSSIPLHHQLTVLLRNKILSGEVAPDEKLPSEKSLTQAFGVSRITVSRALSTLAAQGLVEKRRGTGSFVAPAPQSPANLSERLKLLTFLQAPHHLLNQVTVRKSTSLMPEVFSVNAAVNPLSVTYVAGYQGSAEKPVVFSENWGLRVGEVNRDSDPGWKVTLPGSISSHSISHRISAALVTPLAMGSLALQIGDPVVTVQRRYLADNGAVVAATIFQFRPDRVDLELMPEMFTPD